MRITSASFFVAFPPDKVRGRMTALYAIPIGFVKHKFHFFGKICLNLAAKSDMRAVILEAKSVDVASVLVETLRGKKASDSRAAGRTDRPVLSARCCNCSPTAIPRRKTRAAAHRDEHR